MFVKDQFPGKLWLETPLIHSPHISSRLGCNVYLKLEVSARLAWDVIRSRIVVFETELAAFAIFQISRNISLCTKCTENAWP